MLDLKEIKEMLNKQDERFWEVFDKEEMVRQIHNDNMFFNKRINEDDCKQYLIEKLENRIDVYNKVSSANNNYQNAQWIMEKCNEILKKIKEVE